mmetsp:Transcript_4444/g.11674  ORF Transcript_4444/g.11674 Transcript_4444/m.11674 type:complete len:100 (-) Transcript_4444:1018-1317(-)
MRPERCLYERGSVLALSEGGANQRPASDPLEHTDGGTHAAIVAEPLGAARGSLRMHDQHPKAFEAQARRSAPCAALEHKHASSRGCEVPPREHDAHCGL